MACGDDGDAAIPLTPVPSVASTTPPPTELPAATRTPLPMSGIASVDRAIELVLAGSASSLQEQVRFTKIACAKPPPQGLGGPPPCMDAEPDGTEISVFPTAQCEATYLRPGKVLPIRWPVEGATLFAAYRTPARFFPPGAYVVVFRRHGGAIAGPAWELVLSDDGIVGINYGCGDTPQSLIDAQSLTDEIIAPQE